MCISKTNKFIKTPRLGDTVKVYINRHECKYGVVCGTFDRREHRAEYTNSDGKIIPEHITCTQCVLLKPIDKVRFNKIDYFLELERVEFKTK